MVATDCPPPVRPAARTTDPLAGRPGRSLHPTGRPRCTLPRPGPRTSTPMRGGGGPRCIGTRGRRWDLTPDAQLHPATLAGSSSRRSWRRRSDAHADLEHALLACASDLHPPRAVGELAPPRRADLHGRDATRGAGGPRRTGRPWDRPMLLTGLIGKLRGQALLAVSPGARDLEWDFTLRWVVTLEAGGRLPFRRPFGGVVACVSTTQGRPPTSPSASPSGAVNGCS